MHYYKRNIGDYHKKAGRLSMLEHGAYTLLIDACYDRERFPTRHDALDWLWARTDEEIAAIDFVLDKFFSLQEDGTYIQARVQEELDAYHAMAETNKRIAKEREEKRRNAKNKSKSKALDSKDLARSVHDSCGSVNEAPPNQEPLTTNQEPLTTNQEPKDNNNNTRENFSVIESIADWAHPELTEVNAMLMMGSPPVPAIAQDRYDNYLREFKNYHAEEEVKGSYVRTEGRRKDLLAAWIKRDYTHQQKIKAQSQPARFNIDNEDWSQSTAQQPQAETYHPSHSKPNTSAKPNPKTSVIVNGLWKDPLPGMDVPQTYAYINEQCMPGESKDETYDRLINQMQESV